MRVGTKTENSKTDTKKKKYVVDQNNCESHRERGASTDENEIETNTNDNDDNDDDDDKTIKKRETKKNYKKSKASHKLVAKED